jgi:two-component system, response regulator
MEEPALILHVDDTEADLVMMQTAFRKTGLNLEVHACGNGQEALNYLFGAAEYADRETHPLPDFVLLDLKMPGIDGHEVLRRIKGTETLRRLPVIILTSSNEADDRAKSYENGANSYLVKPNTFEGLIAVAKQVGAYWLTLNVGPPI